MANKSAAIVKRYRRIIAAGCTHGDLGSIARQNEVIAFKERYKPEIIVDLGDIVDTAAFRAGLGERRTRARKLSQMSSLQFAGLSATPPRTSHSGITIGGSLKCRNPRTQLWPTPPGSCGTRSPIRSEN